MKTIMKEKNIYAYSSIKKKVDNRAVESEEIYPAVFYPKGKYPASQKGGNPGAYIIPNFKKQFCCNK